MSQIQTQGLITNQIGLGSKIWMLCSIGLHLIGTVVYGFSIIYLEFINDRTDPRSTYIGDFKYMTYWNLVFHFLFNILSLWTDMFPSKQYEKLRKLMDSFFFCVVFPLSMFVCLSFWTLHMLDKDSVRNPNVRNRCPEWYNHVTHTVNGLMNVMEILITYHSQPDHGHAVTVLIGMYGLYTAFMHAFGTFANIWIYPFMGKVGWTKRLVFYLIGTIKLLLYYISGVYFNQLLWPPNRITAFQNLMV